MSVPRISTSNTETGRVTFPNAIKVKPLDFDRKTLVEHTKAEIAAAKDYLKTNKGSCTSTANWFTTTDKWQTGRFYTNKACHASLPYMQESEYKSVIAFDNGWKRNARPPSGQFEGLSEEKRKNLSLPFLSWFLYVSPYGEFILNRDDFEYCRDYGFIVSGEIPHAVLMNIAIISRHFYEIAQDCFIRFNKMTLEQGIDPTIAYSSLFCTYYSHYAEDYLKRKYIVYSGHRVTNAYSPPVLINLFNGVYGDLASSKKMYKQKTLYNAGTLFQLSKVTYATNLAEWCRADRDFIAALKSWRNPNKDISTYKPPNPFTPRNAVEEQSILRAGEFTFEEGFDFVIPYIDALVRKELNK